MRTTRISLVNDDITLVNINNKWEPFRILEFIPQDQKVRGIWLLTDIEEKIDGGIPTRKISNDWLSSRIKDMEDEYKIVENRIKTLKKIDI